MGLDKKGHYRFTITGDDVDKIDIISYLGSLPEDWKFEVTSANVNIYYDKIKASGKEAKE